MDGDCLVIAGGWTFYGLPAQLGMSDTFFTVPVGKVGRLAKPFQKDAMSNRDPTAQRGRDGSGGVLSTAADYLRFAEMLRRGGSLDNVHLQMEYDRPAKHLSIKLKTISFGPS
jgi:CubicO group peptidase (beta-lactamase class C family)